MEGGGRRSKEVQGAGGASRVQEKSVSFAATKAHRAAYEIYQSECQLCVVVSAL